MLLFSKKRRVTGDNVLLLKTHDVFALSPFTLGGGRCKTILGVDRALGKPCLKCTVLILVCLTVIIIA